MWLIAAGRLLLAFLTSQMTWLLGLAFGGTGLIAGGIYLIFGVPYAMICGGIFFMLFACVIFRGIGNG